MSHATSTSRVGCHTLVPTGSTLPLMGPVGFDSLVEQSIKKIKGGIHLNILVLGETGVGKSTLMDTLFKTHFNGTNVAEHSHKRDKVEVVTNAYEIEENDVRLLLNISECVGYGDQIDRTDALQPIHDYVNQQHQSYLEGETQSKRGEGKHGDSRCHVCIYMISPNSVGLRPLDIVALRQLSTLTNIIPVIAKADTLLGPERKALKKKIKDELHNNDIHTYELPTSYHEIDASESVQNISDQLMEKSPFAVIGSQEVGKEGRRIRSYPWGVLDVEDPLYSDLTSLRQALLCLNTVDLINTTNSVYYAKYRAAHLVGTGYDLNASENESKMQEKYVQKRAEFLQMRVKREKELREAFSEQVKEKEVELKAADMALKNKYEALHNALAVERAALERDIAEMHAVSSKIKKIEESAPMSPTPIPKKRNFRS